MRCKHYQSTTTTLLTDITTEANGKLGNQAGRSSRGPNVDYADRSSCVSATCKPVESTLYPEECNHEVPMFTAETDILTRPHIIKKTIATDPNG